MIKKATIDRYKSFGRRTEIEFQEGCNMIIGRNNAGKSALLQCLNLQNELSVPFKSTEDGIGDPLKPWSRSLDFVFSGEEMCSAIIRHGNNGKVIIPAGNVPIDEFNNILDTDRFEFRLNKSSNTSWNLADLKANSFGFSDGMTGARAHIGVENNRLKFLGIVTGHNAGDIDFLGLMLDYIRSNTYEFKAERFAVGKCEFQVTSTLYSDASNLACVIRDLERSVNKFKRYNDLVRSIIPDIHGVNTRHLSPTQIEIRVWNHPFELEREDLTVPLSDCGTGVGQILAILYVLSSFDTKKYIIIDEPNSFLHPAAARRLIEIIEQHPLHQYFISTHSVEMLRAAASASIHLLKKENGITNIVTSSAKSAEDISEALREVGVRLSDVYGREAVIWVEGDTEAYCLKALLPREEQVGVDFVALLNVGQITSKKAAAKAIINIYKKLSATSALVPQTICFSLDSEELTEDQKADITREAGSKVVFLPRRCYENYLINPAAIKAVFYEDNESVSADVITDWLKSKGGEVRYKATVEWNDDLKDLGWLKKVDAPKLIEDLLWNFCMMNYDKVRGGQALTEYIIKNNPEQLEELIHYARSLLALR